MDVVNSLGGLRAEPGGRPQAKKILMCAIGWPPHVGGVQAYSEFVARAYLSAGFELTVIASRPGPRGWVDLQFPEGALRLWNVGEGRQATLFARMLMAARRIFAAERFDLVHPTTWRAALALTPFRKSSPLAVTVHGREVLIVPFWLRAMMRRTLRSAQVVAAVSNTTLAALKAAVPPAPDNDWIAAFNGISYRAEALAHVREETQTGPIRLYSFCRLEERKNIIGALRAMRLLKDRGFSNFFYTIAGGGPLTSAIGAEIEALGLSDHVTMAGYIDEAEITARYAACDVFVHPQIAAAGGADIEGFGLVIADAMAFGALALVGEAGGPADFVKHNVNGLVVDGEDIEQIARALESVLTDRARLARLAAEGRRWALETLSWDRHVSAILHQVKGLDR